MKLKLTLFITALGLFQIQGGELQNDERGVRDLIGRWNTAYVNMDAKSLAATCTPDFELIDRFGHWLRFSSNQETERLFAWTFKDVYKGKPGPERQIESLRFLAPDVAVVQARAFHSKPTVIDEKTTIPPFWEINTYLVTRKNGEWLIAIQNIHNQIPPQMEGTGSKLDQSVLPGRSQR